MIVGQGELDNPSEGLSLSGEKHIEYMPAVGALERGMLMKKAKAVLMPTLYLEPFGGVNVEAQFCGTPVITSDWGAFPETVLHGVTGFRCRSFDEFCTAVSMVDKIKPENCRRWAEDNYSMKRVGKMYEAYFKRLDGLYGDGWYGREGCDMTVLEKYYP